jgi:hypothetical protein
MDSFLQFVSRLRKDRRLERIVAIESVNIDKVSAQADAAIATA